MQGSRVKRRRAHLDVSEPEVLVGEIVGEIVDPALKLVKIAKITKITKITRIIGSTRILLRWVIQEREPHPAVRQASCFAKRFLVMQGRFRGPCGIRYAAGACQCQGQDDRNASC